MDMNQKVKSKVLQQIMDMMDERGVSDLKSKSPKFAKVDIQSDDPELAENLKDKLVDGIEEEAVVDEKFPNKAMPEMEETPEEEPESDEDMKRLLDMYQQLK